MQKLTFLISALAFSVVAPAQSPKDDAFIFDAINVKNTLQIIYPIKISNNIYTPYALRFTRPGDMAPSCALINKLNSTKPLEMISPSDGQYGNCHQAIKPPVVVKIGKDFFANYVYVIEDPRAEFETNYSIIKLHEKNFSQCKNEDKIAYLIKKNVEFKFDIKKATELALKSKKCEI